MNLCRTRGEHATVERDKPQSRIVAHVLVLRKRGTATEVLLLRRPPDAALMAKMLELPPLPVEAVSGREPVLRLRHCITNTNYYVQIFAESAPGVAPLALQIAGEEESEPGRPAPDVIAAVPTGRPTAAARVARSYEDDVFTSEPDIAESGVDPRLTAPEGALLGQIPASESDLEWTSTARLQFLPLTGLTRKVLQRLGVMSLPKLQI